MDNEAIEEINNEESDTNIGYYLRSKRRKIEKSTETENTSKGGQVEVLKKKSPVSHMPAEVMLIIFQNLSFHELCTKIRLVNRRFKYLAEHILNLSYQKLANRIGALIKSTYDGLQATQDDMEIRCICKMLNILEIINLQHSIVMTTLWRYVYNEYYKVPPCCMYGGLLIDAYYEFIHIFTHLPNQLYASSIIKDYTLPPQVTKIISMTKTFCVHFEKASEEPINKALINSGCKIVDLLDSGIFAQRDIIYERSTADTFFAKYCYYFNNSWFIAVPIAPGKIMNWRQKQRMMHMRLRRVVMAHYDMHLQQAQYERESMLRLDSQLRVKKPGNNVYTGYGDVEDMFFYYGVMNDGAYFQKFHIEDDNDDEDDEDDAEILLHNDDIQNHNNNNNNNINNNPPVNNVGNNSSDENILYRLPHLGLRIDVMIKCPISYAPLKYIQQLKYEEREKLMEKPRIRGTTEIIGKFECYGAHYPRLPTHYTYDFRPTKAM